MAYIDKCGVEYSDDRKTLVHCPDSYKGDYTIPEGVTTIGKAAFADCFSYEILHENNGITLPITGGLMAVHLPTTIEVIEDGAFSNCWKLSSLLLPESLRIIGTHAFYGCESIKEISIPEGVNIIGARAFENCNSLQRLSLPNSIQSIGSAAIADNMYDDKPWWPHVISALKEIIVPKGQKQRFIGMFGDYSTDLSTLIIEK